MSPLQLYTTRMCAKQTFVPADPSGQVGLFACGPTVYDLPHLGHAKTYTQFDFLVRLLRTRGFAVTYVQNITDVDDEIIRRARELGIDAPELARRHERAYLDDMRALRNDSVDVYARASDYVDEVVRQNGALTLRSKVTSNVPSSSSCVAPNGNTPALLTRMSKSPTSSVRRLTSAGTVRSVAMKRASPPSAAMAETTSSPRIASRPVTITVAPSRARVSVAARPMPEVPALTRAVWVGVMPLEALDVDDHEYRIVSRHPVLRCRDHPAARGHDEAAEPLVASLAVSARDQPHAITHVAISSAYLPIAVCDFRSANARLA
jgi:hypothetical protein